MFKDKKVLHIVAGDLSAGAARGAYWLHQGLIEQGIHSKMLINSTNTFDDPDIETVIKSKLDKLKSIIHSQIDSLPLRLYSKWNKNKFSTALGGFDISEHPLYNWADILHLHWINAGFVNIKHLEKIKKPIIWTLRDMWPFTGGCHYTMGCEKYISGCGNCPQLGSNKRNDLSNFVLKRKIRYLPKTINIVGISPWISERAKESKLFSNYDVQTIFNNVNCNDFYPIEKKLAKKILGINTHKKIILTGAQNLEDFHKGFGKYIEALNILDKSEYYLMFLGKLSNELAQNLEFEQMNFGFLNDYISMRLVYSAADVFVAPSLMDAFGKTIVEAMACGTPVVCFDATGPKDIVIHKLNGFKAKAFDSEDLANGIKWVTDCQEYNEIAKKARTKALEEFDSQVISSQYIELYKQLIQ